MGGASQSINMVESHESNDDYSIPSTIAMAPSLPIGFSSPNASRPGSMGYTPYSPSVSSPMRSMLRPGEPGIHPNGNQDQDQVSEVTTANVSVVSPTASPQWYGGRSSSGYGDPLLYFDQSSIPLTGMQDPDPSASNNDDK